MKPVPYSAIKKAGPNVIPIGGIKVWSAYITFRVNVMRSVIYTTITTGPFDRNVDAKSWGQKVVGQLLSKEFRPRRIQGFQIAGVSTLSSNQRGINNPITGIYIESITPEKFVKDIERHLLTAVEAELEHMLKVI